MWGRGKPKRRKIRKDHYKKIGKIRGTTPLDPRLKSPSGRQKLEVKRRETEGENAFLAFCGLHPNI
jgi:hypothetical protein